MARGRTLLRPDAHLLGFALAAALAGCPGPGAGVGNQPATGPVGGGGGASGAGGACSVSWEGATRSFAAPRVLSSDPASTVLGTLFLSGGPAELLVFEPGTPQLVLVTADASAAPQRLDSAALPYQAGKGGTVAPAADGSGALVTYGSAVDYVSSDGAVHGPFALSSAGLLSIDAAVALEQGAGGVLLGLGAGGPAWTAVGPSGLGPLTTFALGETADASQPPALLWDDGTGNLWAVVPLAYDPVQRALFAIPGGGSPFTFGTPVRLDLASPGGVQGYELAQGPSGDLAVLLAEGPGETAELAGFSVAPTGAVAGGVIAALPSGSVLGFQSPTSGGTPWDSGCGFGGACDPAVRFAGNGDLVAAWSLDGKLSIARLPVGAGAWQAPKSEAGGPLLSPLATDGAGDLAAVAQTQDGDAFAIEVAGGSPGLEPLPQIVGLAPGPFVAATAANGGALWALEPEGDPSSIFGWTFALSGGTPASGPTATLPGGETVTGLAAAGPTAPSSTGESYFGTAAPGWMLIGGELGGSADLLLATFDPGSATLGTPASVAAAGWQQSGGVSSPELFVDGSGTALVAFTQSVGGNPNLYVTAAPAGAKAQAPCAPMSAVSGSAAPSLALDPTGAGRLLVSRDSPATVSLAQ